ncbi:MAG TPA: acetolactate synthase large subunit [Streptosporangiaceae bacterium]|nr:acetolactate synthase large subunit [Streptosporangiaceae bacterium]
MDRKPGTSKKELVVQELTGAQALVRSLEQQGVEVVFGLPGGTILPTYDPLLSSSLRHVLVRHEQGAGHAAEGYAWATGRPGVCMATSGPGATNLVTALSDAYMDSVPMVAITGQVGTSLIGTDAFQEADITGITLPITKHSELVTDVARIPAAVAEAFHIATTGRPGPVLIDVPKDIQQATGPWSWPPVMDLPGYQVPGPPSLAAIRAAANLLLQARRPVLYVGGGVIKSDSHADLLRLAELSRAPVTTTLMARGALPDGHPLALGMPGMHGTYSAVAALQEADLVVALGARFDDRVTGKLSDFAPRARIVHADIDPAEIGKNRKPDVAIIGDLRLTLAALADTVAAAISSGDANADRAETADWLAVLDGWKRQFPLRYTQDSDGPLKPQYVTERLSALTGGEAIIVAGVGQHQMHAAQHYAFTRPRSWINSGGAGTMGFAVPAAMGAQVGRPGELVVAIDGDGCFQMTAQELATCAIEKIPIKVLIFNNGFLGMVRQWQELFYDERYSSVELGTAIPDYVKLAEAYGCLGLRCERADEVDTVLDKALAPSDVPVVVDFRTHDREGVFPMVPAGLPNDEIVLGPEFSAEEQRAATRREMGI